MVPALFLAHGSPMMAIEQSEYTKFLNKLGESIKPKAIVVFTAHWNSELLTISASDDEYGTIYDFYGFPEELYKIKYKAKGSSEVATFVQQELKKHGIESRKDYSRGLDHGAWTLLMHLYPLLNIPVVQISVNPNLDVWEQLKIGNALKRLGEEDILIIGSGNTVHNLSLVDWGKNEVDKWAEEFDDWLIQMLKDKDVESLSNYRELAPHAKLAAPTTEHLIPLFITLGSNLAAEAKILHRSYELGNLSYLCYKF